MHAVSVPEPWLFAAMYNGLLVPCAINITFRGNVLIRRVAKKVTKKQYLEFVALAARNCPSATWPTYKAFCEATKEEGLVAVATLVGCETSKTDMHRAGFCLNISRFVPLEKAIRVCRSAPFFVVKGAPLRKYLDQKQISLPFEVPT